MRNISIIVPTHERHNYLSRCIDYYGKFDCKIIICDSSRNIYHRALSDNASYHHLPGSKFAEKILFGISACDSEFIALSPDDDFLFEESLYRAGEILLAYHAVQACVGDVLMFYDTEPFRVVAAGDGGSLDFGDSTSVEGRIVNYLSNYEQVLWSLFRADALKLSFEIIRDAAYDNENFFELTVAAVCAGNGGICRIGDTWILRELSSKLHWGVKHESIHSLSHPFDDKDVKNFISSIDSALSPGIGEKALLAYLSSHGTYRKLLLLARDLISKISFNHIHFKSLKTVNIASDIRFQPMRRVFDEYYE